ncbi:ATP-binding protein [Saccharolobus shibatae]|uniref:VirB4/TraG-like conjugation ATPase n=1 Tax=Saccharolobus shibatae TaxID=2286 RepID=A0A8F5BS46_9CREN|nr:TraM recognition domain-containing protein [Saccharolobus shibatae]QXJ30337.1 VirB4/TraG-like conjugation ATPase [Saccharolobus shibatae]QXJ30439.1 VirB4/TraG-like conjugation ATPase [Saccharolobus shibatae]
MKLYKLLFTDKSQDIKDPTSIFGHVFEIIYEKGELTEVYVRTNSDANILRDYFNIVDAEELKPKRFVAEVRLKRESDFYNRIEWNELRNFVAKMEKGQQLRIWVVLESRINNLFLKKADKLKIDAQRAFMGRRQKEVLASILESEAKGNLYLITIHLFDDDKARLKLYAKTLRDYIFTNSKKLKIQIRKAKKFEDRQPKISWWDSVAKYKTWLWADEDGVKKIATLPTPQQLKLQVSLNVRLPYYKLDRKPEICIGKDLIYNEEVCLEPIDFIGHAFFFGASRSGKSNTLEVIAKQLKNYGVVIFIDPNSQSARKLSQIADMYFSITKEKPNFGLNILQLPHIFEDRKKNIDYQIANVLELFDKLLQLPENAPNVRYILQVLLYQMYKLTDNVTFQDVYNAVIDLYNGNLDLDVDDEQFQKEVEMLQKMQPQSFFSILTRIKMLVENDTFKYITSETTLDWEKLIPKLKKGLIVFDVGKSSGEIVSQTVQMMIALSLFYYVFRRDQRGEEKIPIYFIVDEAQNIAHFSFLGDILAEAAKYALHLILATQSYVRLMDMAGDGNARGLMANTNVKLVMRIVEGKDASEIAKSAGLNEFVDIFPKLSRGMGFLTIGGKPGELSAVKFIQVNYSGLGDKEGKLTEGFEPKPRTHQDLSKMLNPILQLIERRPDALEQVVLYKVFKNGKKIYMPDLLRELGVNRDRVEDVINKLASAGMIDVTKEGNKKAIIYVKGLFPLKHIVENDEGRKVALRVIKKYYEKGYIIVPGKQQGDVRPDFLALKYDSNYKVKYDGVIAVEIESPNELSVHIEQVVRNMKKYNELPNAAKDRIAEIHIWTSEETYPKLEEAYKKFLEDTTIDESYKKKVKIFVLKVGEKQKTEPKVEENQAKTKKIPQSTGEFTEAKTAAIETANNTTAANSAVTASSAAVGKTPNDGKAPEGPKPLTGELTQNSESTQGTTNGKLGSLTLKDLVIEILGKENGGYIIQINGNKYYIKEEYIKILQTAAKDQELIKNVSLNKLELKIDLGVVDYTIPLAPL